MRRAAGSSVASLPDARASSASVSSRSVSGEANSGLAMRLLLDQRDGRDIELSHRRQPDRVAVRLDIATERLEL